MMVFLPTLLYRPTHLNIMVILLVQYSRFLAGNDQYFRSKNLEGSCSATTFYPNQDSKISGNIPFPITFSQGYRRR